MSRLPDSCHTETACPDASRSVRTARVVHGAPHRRLFGSSAGSLVNTPHVIRALFRTLATRAQPLDAATKDVNRRGRYLMYGVGNLVGSAASAAASACAAFDAIRLAIAREDYKGGSRIRVSIHRDRCSK